MELITKEQAYELWEDLKEYTWEEVYYMLKKQSGNFSKLKDTQISTMMKETNYFQLTGFTFPTDEDEFYTTINEYAEHYSQVGT